jgi:hypothetical protein
MFPFSRITYYMWELDTGSELYWGREGGLCNEITTDKALSSPICAPAKP